MIKMSNIEGCTTFEIQHIKKIEADKIGYDVKKLQLELKNKVLKNIEKFTIWDYYVKTALMSNLRCSHAHVRTRNEVVGSKQKIFAQKGRGKARAKNKQSPLFRGGGAIFGPTK